MSIKLFVLTFRQALHTFFGVGPCCRFTPTCSNYMRQAIETHGWILGSWFGIKRILRCHPFGAYGYDPIPTKNETSDEVSMEGLL